MELVIIVLIAVEVVIVSSRVRLGYSRSLI